MPITKYTKWNGTPLDGLSIEELLDALQEFFLQSGFSYGYSDVSNPHQIDAALFAFASPLSKGALLADEVGLGKTIEAGLVISQRWAESKRRILIIAPSNLRKQWHQEMNEKFFIPCVS